MTAGIGTSESGRCSSLATAARVSSIRPLAVNQRGFRVGLFFLALAGILLAHVANNLMNDLFD